MKQGRLAYLHRTICETIGKMPVYLIVLYENSFESSVSKTIQVFHRTYHQYAVVIIFSVEWQSIVFSRCLYVRRTIEPIRKAVVCLQSTQRHSSAPSYRLESRIIHFHSITVRTVASVVRRYTAFHNSNDIKLYVIHTINLGSLPQQYLYANIDAYMLYMLLVFVLHSHSKQFFFGVPAMMTAPKRSEKQN